MLIGLFLAATLTVPPVEGVHPDERPAYEAMLTAQARESDRIYAGSACDSAKVENVSTQVLVRIADHPELVVWRERLKVTGCGRTSIENINVGRSGGSPTWRMGRGLPGDSLVDITLQQSTLPAAIAQARMGVPADCQDQALHDVYIAARPGDVDISPPGVAPAAGRANHPSVTLPDSAKDIQDTLDLTHAWMEVWPFEFCGHDRTLGVVIVPLKDQVTSLYLFFLPVWREIEAHGASALPARAPGG